MGEERAKLLARLKIFTVEDLLLHKPRRYEDRRKFLPIRDLKLKEAATVRGKIVAAGVKRFKKGTRAMFECVFDDGTAHAALPLVAGAAVDGGLVCRRPRIFDFRQTGFAEAAQH